jgi:Ca-activated chloride channel family protein
MHLAYPHYSGLILLAVLTALLAVWVLVRKYRAWYRLADAAIVTPLLLVRRWMHWLKMGLVATACALLGIVLLGPQWGKTEEEPPPPAQGRDVVLLLDVSRSMLAEDIVPNRLEKAKAELRQLSRGLEESGGCRVALIAFADRPVVLCPLTWDFRCFEDELNLASLTTLRTRGQSPNLDGTQLGAALNRARGLLDSQTAAYADLVIFSDGGDMETDTLTAAEDLAKMGVAIHAIGVGDSQKGSPIPVSGRNGQTTYLTYKGQQVETRLEEEVLRQVAHRSSGFYATATPANAEVEELLGHLLANRPARELRHSESTTRWIHRYQWFLAPAWALLLLEMFIRGNRPSTPTLKQTYFRWVRRRTTLPQTVSVQS